jgi:hypothetical protein
MRTISQTARRLGYRDPTRTEKGGNLGLSDLFPSGKRAFDTPIPAAKVGVLNQSWWQAGRLPHYAATTLPGQKSA